MSDGFSFWISDNNIMTSNNWFVDIWNTSFSLVRIVLQVFRMSILDIKNAIVDIWNWKPNTHECKIDLICLGTKCNESLFNKSCSLYNTNTLLVIFAMYLLSLTKTVIKCGVLCKVFHYATESCKACTSMLVFCFYEAWFWTCPARSYIVSRNESDMCFPWP